MFSHERSLDYLSLRQVISVISDMIQEVNYELKFIMCGLHSNAIVWLNTLGFFKCMQAKV